MLNALTQGPLLWFLNRGTGVTLMVVLTMSMVLGILSAGTRAGGAVPAFVTHHLHRNLSVLGLGLVLAHMATAVADTYVDIRWWQALSPWGATYQPVWLALGTLSFDVMLVIALSTAVKGRLGARTWHGIHLLGYACWPLAIVHAAGIGTDSGELWARTAAASCCAALLTAVVVRVTYGRRTRARGAPASAGRVAA